MTDTEIMKALECCSTNNQKCYDCPLYTDCVMGVPSKNISRVAFDLIQRQQYRLDRIIEQLEAEKYRGMEGLEPIKIAFNFGINKALDLLKGVQNEQVER